MEKIDEIFKTIDNGIIEIILFPDQTVKKFKEFTSLKEFVDTEIAFWKNYTKGAIIKNIYENFVEALNNLNEALSNQNLVNNTIPKNKIIRAVQILKSNTIIYSQTSAAKFLTDLYAKHITQADAAYSFLYKNSVRSDQIGNTNYFIGLMSAFIVKYTDDILNNKLSSEEKSLSEISKKYSETTNELELYYKDKIDELETSTSEFKDNLTDWKSKLEVNLSTVLQAREKDFNDLKNYYEEKLRIEGPAHYWNKLHEEYLKKGRWWIGGSIAVSAIFVGVLLIILYDFPSSLTYAQGEFSISNLKATIVLTLIVSAFIYIIRLLVKLATSAYHLSRDAKERYQLTHIFLSMVKDKSIENSDKHIILQSLFSRADTGLLKGDHSPVLPDGFASAIMKNFAGK